MEVSSTVIAQYIAQYDPDLAADLESIEEEFADVIGTEDGHFKRAAVYYVKEHWADSYGRLDHRFSGVASIILKGLGGLFDDDSDTWVFGSAEALQQAEAVCESVYWDKKKRKYRI